MKITYVGRKIDVTDSLKKWAEKKLSKLDKFFEDDADVKLTIGRQQGRFALECTIRTKTQYLGWKRLTMMHMLQ